jgi:hypothetical protein
MIIPGKAYYSYDLIFFVIGGVFTLLSIALRNCRKRQKHQQWHAKKEL